MNLNIQLIIICGPSGSGKTTLSQAILKKSKDGIILNTDNYYKTDLKSKILSEILPSFFDRKISFNSELFIKDLKFILKNGFSAFYYKYNFKSKSITKIYKKTQNIKFIIVEGIFGQEVFNYISSKRFFLVKLKANKETCMRRVIRRDFKERGKTKNLAKREFLKAWDIYYKNISKNYSRNFLKKIIFRNKSDLNFLLKEISNIVN